MRDMEGGTKIEMASSSSRSNPWTPGPGRVVDDGYDISVQGASGPGWYDKIADDVGSDADARLIAAAPEMAELLEWLRESLDADGQDYPVKRIDALLARIRGEDA